MKKSIKLFTLSILATSAVCLPLTSLLSSCTTNSNETTTSKIVINKQSPDETSTDTSKTPPTLFVDATTDNGTLKYTWQVSKDNGTTWETIDDATSSTYQIPETDFKAVKEESTWQYKVNISVDGDNSTNITSNVYKVNIKPSSTSTTDTVNISQNLIKNLSTTTTEGISLSIAASSDSNKFLRYDWYLQKDGENSFTKIQTGSNSMYSINASDLTGIKEVSTWKVYVDVYPEGEESLKQTSNISSVKITPQTQQAEGPIATPPPTNETVTARPNETGSNYTKVKYDTERWIGDNSVSILLTSTPNINYLKTYVSEYLTQNEKDSESSNIPVKYSYYLMSYLQQSLTNNTYSLKTYSGGTGWMLDYSYDTTNTNLVNYYITTNIHVLNASYSVTFPAYINNTVHYITASVPISKESVTDVGVYLSQPQYNDQGPAYNQNVIASDSTKWTTDWYKTSVTLDNIYDSLIPIGAYTNTGSESLGSPYAVQFTYRESIDLKLIEYKYMYPKDKSSADTMPSRSSKEATDIAVLKITEQKNKFATHPSNTSYETMFSKIEKMFKTDTTDSEAAKNSSYISRLNAILTMATSKDSSAYTKSKVDELFMFADYNTNLKSNNTISIAGFPALYAKNSSTKKEDTYVTFNSNTITYGLHTSYDSSVGKAREFLEYYYKGQIYYTNYNWPINALLRGVMLNPGSSGSMGITDEYKLAGIYWGGLQSWDYFDGAMTRIYSYNDSRSMVKVWLTYIEQKDPNSKLLTTFKALESKGYFAS